MLKAGPRLLPRPGAFTVFTASNLPPERCGLFLALRRGLPLALACGLLAMALLHTAGRGWWILGAMACLAEAVPTFRRGEAFRRNRTAISRWDGLWVRTLRPAARVLGLEDAWLRSFFAWNNRRVKELFLHHRARRALVLLPHCIQLSRCRAEVVRDPEACAHCGLCPLDGLLSEGLKGRWEFRISNRSHKAYQEVRAFRPDLMVAVACPDRLLKGLLRLPDTPAYALPLELPHGMCVDTAFEPSRLLAVLEALAEPRADAPGAKVQPLRREGVA